MAAAEFGAVEVAVREHIAHQLDQRWRVFGEAGGLQPCGHGGHADVEIHPKLIGTRQQAAFGIVRLNGEGVGGVVLVRPGGPSADRELETNVNQGRAMVFKQEHGVAAHLPFVDGRSFGRGMGPGRKGEAPHDEAGCRQFLERANHGANSG